MGDLAWWEIFQDEALQALISTALAENYDLRIAAARVLDARAQVTITRSFQFPDVSANASAPYVAFHWRPGPDPDEGDVQPAGNARPLLGDRSLGPPAAGHGGGPGRSARLGGRAAVRDHHADQRRGDRVLPAPRARPGAGDLPTDAGLPARLLRLVKLRYEGGVAALIDVRQAEVLLYTAAETIPDVERRIEQTENLISLLLGRSPAAVPRGRPLPARRPTLPASPQGFPRACSSAGRTSGRRRTSSRRPRPGSAWPRPTTFRGSCSRAPRAPAEWRSTATGSAPAVCSPSRPR